MLIQPQNRSVLVEDAWWTDAKCRSLSPQESDAIFFPGSGGKPTRAKAFCGDCPLVKACLTKACQEGLQGFIAGTTEEERRIMSNMFPEFSLKVTVHMAVENVMPSTLGKRRVFRKLIPSQPDTLDYLDNLEGPILG